MSLGNDTWARLASRCLLEIPEDIGVLFFLSVPANWLGGRDSNPDNVLQRHASYRWTTSQSGIPRRAETLIISGIGVRLKITVRLKPDTTHYAAGRRRRCSAARRMDTQKHVSRKQNVGVDGLIANTVSRLPGRPEGRHYDLARRSSRSGITVRLKPDTTYCAAGRRRRCSAARRMAGPPTRLPRWGAMDTQKHVSRKQNVGVDGLITNTVSRLPGRPEGRHYDLARRSSRSGIWSG